MAKYEHLPVYKKAMELSTYLHELVRNFSRYHKYSIGSDMRQMSFDIIKLIITANSEENKEPVLKNLVIHCEMIKNMLILAKDIKAFQNFSSFQHAAGISVALCKQSQGWLNSINKSQNYQPPEKRVNKRAQNTVRPPRQ